MEAVLSKIKNLPFKGGDALVDVSGNIFYFNHHLLTKNYLGIADCTVFKSYDDYKGFNIHNYAVKDSTYLWFAFSRHILFEKTRKMTTFGL